MREGRDEIVMMEWHAANCTVLWKNDEDRIGGGGRGQVKRGRDKQQVVV